jgi:hypothetical protein
MELIVLTWTIPAGFHITRLEICLPMVMVNLLGGLHLVGWLAVISSIRFDGIL